jgi:hypothetical protein
MHSVVLTCRNRFRSWSPSGKSPWVGSIDEMERPLSRNILSSLIASNLQSSPNRPVQLNHIANSDIQHDFNQEIVT